MAKGGRGLHFTDRHIAGAADLASIIQRQIRRRRKPLVFEPTPQAPVEPEAREADAGPILPAPRRRRGVRRMLARYVDEQSTAEVFAQGVIVVVMLLPLVFLYGMKVEKRRERARQRAQADAAEGTRAFLARLERALPTSPSSPTEVLPTIHETLRAKGFRDNGLNTPTEVLYAVTHEAVLREQGDQRFRGDTDGDGQPEYVDLFGHPLVYFSTPSIRAYRDRPPRYATADPRPMRPHPVGRARDGYVGRAQVWSLGPDGEPHTDDDVWATDEPHSR